MLRDRRRIHRGRERQIATEHGHHGSDFKQREGAPWTHPWPAPKGYQNLGSVATREHGEAGDEAASVLSSPAIVGYPRCPPEPYARLRGWPPTPPPCAPGVGPSA